LIYKMRIIAKVAAGFLLAAALCGCHKSGPSPEAATIGCASKLRQIDKAKKAWAAKSGAGSNDAPTWDDLSSYFRYGQLSCPGGGTYTIGSLSELPKCSIPAHNDYFLAHQQPTQ
jgi:hypothetical protein